MKRYVWLVGAWVVIAVCAWLSFQMARSFRERIDRAYLDGFRDGGDSVIQEVRKWPTNLFSGSEGKR